MLLRAVARDRVLIATALAVVGILSACPKRGDESADEPTPPPFRAGVSTGLELKDPPPPAEGKFGLAYLEQVYPRIREGWGGFVTDCGLRLPPSDRLNDRKLQATIIFMVDQQGKLVSLAVSQKSGDAHFDGAAEEIVREAAPFPAPPTDLVSDDDAVHLAWLFARDHRLAGIATAEVSLVEWPPARAVQKMLAGGNITAASSRLLRAAEALSADAAPAEHDELSGLGRDIAVRAVLEGLGSEDNGVLRLALGAAAAAKLRSAAAQVLGIAKNAVDKRTRLEAIAALGHVGDKDAVPLLVAVLDGTSDNGREMSAARVAAARALADLGKGNLARTTLAAQLEAKDDKRRLEALAVLAVFAVPEAIPALADSVGSRSASRAARQASYAALGVAAAGGDKARALKALRRGLDSKDAATRAACARGLAAAAAAGAKSGRVTYWKLISLLKDRDERVRAGAVLAAARVDPKRFAKDLYAVRKDRSAAVHAALAEALAAVPGPVAYKKTVALSQSPSVAVRRKAVAALLARPEKQAKEVAAGLIKDVDMEVRLLAMKALDGVDALQPYLNVPEADLRAAVLARLVSVRGRQAMLVEVFTRLERAPAGSADRVRVAAAWLQP